MNLASYIDHTILKPDCTAKEIKKICDEAAQYGFYAVCVPPFYVKYAASVLEGKPVKIATVIGFPMGYTTTPSKVEEIKRAIDEGADEVDAVVNICAVKDGNWNFVANDVDSMCTAVHMKGKSIKIILETALLTEKEITKLCEIVLHSGVDFVKTSTGFNGQGATLEAVKLLKSLVGDKAKIKASGGIRTRLEAERFIEAGASRIGSSSGIAIVS
ncbi:MAG: deoxyribose-phosphate aldolase [Phaeodactylibacter sp.]|nr:deoxyribose-phosphate aldolase [Phaeodactylibacter sp.]MCB9304329.1 deoxyribose-phosphate aldolase [Lewinellaceae bacterium]HQU59055.1 deoxyribose-phosphate aldolase [Saprospiraceae bacterium]